MSEILVTGGGGFIGARVIRKLLERGHNVTLYDSFTQYVFPMSLETYQNIENRLHGIQDQIRIIRSSTEYYDFLRKSVKETKPDTIIHLAAMPLANMAITHPDEAVLTIMNGTLNVLRAAQDAGCVKRVVYVSSSMVYGDFHQIPVKEDHPKNPKEVYGSLKLSGEVVVRSFCELGGMEHTIVRPSAVYGPTDNNRRVLSIFLDNALKGKPLTVNGADRALDFSFVDDTAEGIVLASLHENAANETFNITRGEGRTIKEAAEIIGRLVPGTEVIIDEPESWSPARGALDISHARERIGYDPKVSLEEGLRIYHEYLMEQRGITIHEPMVGNL